MHALAIFFFPFANLLLLLLLPHSLLKHPTDSARQLEFNSQASTHDNSSYFYRQLAVRFSPPETSQRRALEKVRVVSVEMEDEEWRQSA